MRAVAILLAVSCWADGPGRLVATHRDRDFELTADPGAQQWANAAGVVFNRGPVGESRATHQTEVRATWTKDHIYFLFICPYEKLHLKPESQTATDTWALWDWDVAEVFVGGDFNNIGHYREFQVSPRGEWIDLDILRAESGNKTDEKWNSGFAVKARIDEARKIWYGEMKIPISAINGATAEAGRELRINFYRLQGPPPDRVYVAWQPTGAMNYHVPAAFGRLVLGK